jgi:uncharacterized protein
MRVVIDTNVLLISISRRAKHHPIFKAILDGTINLCISNAILEEYEEIIGKHWSPIMGRNTVELLLKSPFVHRFDPHYNWILIKEDPDDDKFADCSVAANANYLVTDDKHYNVLKSSIFPPFNIISADAFLELIMKHDLP